MTLAARRGDLDAEQVRLIDQSARLVREQHTLTVLDEQVVEAARARTPQQLRRWLQRFLTRHEPEAARRRRLVGLDDRRVTIAQSVTRIGFVTGEVAAEDAAAIDARLSSLARSLGADDPRNEQQRRSDMFAGLLLGTTVLEADRGSQESARSAADTHVELLEVESIDPVTGEFLGTRQVCLDSEGEPVSATGPTAGVRASTVIHEGQRGPGRIGVVVALSSLLGADETPGELADRSASIPAADVRELAAREGVLFSRLLTDDGGRLLDVTELGRFASARLAEAVRIRSGSCEFPTCRVPGWRCDLDHHEPVPRGPTSAADLGPICRRHHRGKTFAGLAAHRDLDITTWTLATAHTYRCLDEPMPLFTRESVSSGLADGIAAAAATRLGSASPSGRRTVGSATRR